MEKAPTLRRHLPSILPQQCARSSTHSIHKHWLHLVGIYAKDLVTAVPVLEDIAVIGHEGSLMVRGAIFLPSTLVIEQLHVAVDVGKAAATMAQRASQVIDLEEGFAYVKVTAAVLQKALLQGRLLGLQTLQIASAERHTCRRC